MKTTKMIRIKHKKCKSDVRMRLVEALVKTPLFGGGGIREGANDMKIHDRKILQARRKTKTLQQTFLDNLSHNVLSCMEMLA